MSEQDATKEPELAPEDEALMNQLGDFATWFLLTLRSSIERNAATGALTPELANGMYTVVAEQTAKKLDNKKKSLLQGK